MKDPQTGGAPDFVCGVSCVLAHERQTISRGEVRGVLHALLPQGSSRLVVFLDSEYVFQAITDIWFPSMTTKPIETETVNIGSETGYSTVSHDTNFLISDSDIFVLSAARGMQKNVFCQRHTVKCPTSL